MPTQLAIFLNVSIFPLPEKQQIWNLDKVSEGQRQYILICIINLFSFNA